ncbi:hypothetical protein CMP1-42 [Clavibacter phage CMP1]|uniref:Uncharacterized protein n=1 Tax=Clavibacter phage CMP1 TaxID=686439 RepID=D0U226_9CAUD|nr:hypothetical protein CMP1-42 [Clavibacter phage CMP1]ACY35938.1 hypothetical protein CMP1-42 [Clavibacter phage CMP1]
MSYVQKKEITKADGSVVVTHYVNSGKPGAKTREERDDMYDEIAFWYAEKYGDNQIALKAMCSSRTVSRWRSRMNLPRNPHSNKTGLTD